MVAVPGSLPVRGEAEFRVLKENWSKYEIIEGEAIVWLRAVLVKLFEIDTSNLPPGTAISAEGEYLASTSTVVTAFFTDPSMKGEPTPGGVPPEELASGGEELPFTQLEEPFNKYLVHGPKPKVIRVKAVATGIRIFRDKFNAFRDPVIQVNNQIVVSRPRPARPDELL